MADTSMYGNSVLDVKTVGLVDNPSPLDAGSKLSIYAASQDLYFTGGEGTAVQVTSGPSLAFPVGAVMLYAGTTAPKGWTFCDGSAVSRNDYGALFRVISTSYGGGDGSTTFNLPNLNGRTTIGAGTYDDPVSGSITRGLAQRGGAERHKTTEAELPSHTHVQNPHTHSIFDEQGRHPGLGGGNIAAYDGCIMGATIGGQGLVSDSISAVNQSTGSGLSHNNMQPYLVLNYIIKH